MDSKNNIGHSADISFTAELPIPIYNGNNSMDFEKLASLYKNELLDSVLPFWLEHSQDHEYGGYFTCLDREGKVFDTDKFIWLQCREVWMFSMLYNKVEKRKEWLDCAVQGGEFLKKYGHDSYYNWYFSLDRSGRPLVEPYNIFSYTFATMAFGQLSLATGNQEYADIAKKTFDIILSKADLHKETPFGEKESSRKTIYGISDFMFRFWYRYVFTNRTLIETGAQQVVWEKRIKPDYCSYMGLVFEKVCMDYLNSKNARGELPILYTSIGRWWGTNAATHGQEKIDLIANDGKDYLFGECKWRNDKLDISVLKDLKAKADAFRINRKNSYYVLFSKSGFTEAVLNEVRSDDSILLVDLAELMTSC